MCVRDRAALTQSPAKCGSYVAAFSEPQHNKRSRPSPIFYCLSKTAVSSFTRVPGAASQKKKKKSFTTWRGGRERPKARGDFKGVQKCNGGVWGRGWWWNDRPTAGLDSKRSHQYIRHQVRNQIQFVFKNRLPNFISTLTAGTRLDFHIFRH